MSPTGEPGSFSWAGLLTPAADAARRFYGTLLGWESEQRTTADGRGYSVMRRGDEDVALLYEISDLQRSLGAGPNWATFVTVADVEATAAKAAASEGAVAIPPYEVGQAGRIAVITDPEGARLSLWQSHSHPGPARRRGPGTCCWNELATPDLEASARFYTNLFGWGIFHAGHGHAFINNRGRVQGLMQAIAHPEAPARWLPYFEVDSVRETMERCLSAGGELRAADHEPAPGPFAVLRDPDGADFGVCEARSLCASGLPGAGARPACTPRVQTGP